MQLFQDLNQVNLTQPTILTIGTFDGLHLGHQNLLQQLNAAAKNHQAMSVVLAFHPRPKTVLAPHLPSDDYLTTATERITLFERLGLDVLLLVPFTRELSQVTAEAFMGLLKARLNMIELWAGHDFALGKGREGNLEKLSELGQTLGYQLHETAPVIVNEQIVSSTRIRHLLMDGNIPQATAFLGRYPAITGEVGHGAKLGRTLGFPTANLITPPERLLPANGIYATFMVRAKTGQRYLSATNVGVRPHFDGTTRTVEAYILDFDEDIYGETFTLEFVTRLRPEEKFDTLEGLLTQMAKDVLQARTILSSKSL